MSEWYGDADLAAATRELIGSGHPTVAVATVTPDGTSIAGRGANPEGDFEIGSISKGVTGLLYCDARDRGEVTEDTTLGELLRLDAAAPVAGLTLGSLAIHRSGLPRLPRAAAPLRRTVRLWREGTNPYGETLEELLDQVRGLQPGRPKPRYSNLGYQLLGHAVAHASGTTYAELVRTRLAEPLGLSGCYVPARPEDLRPDAVVGRSRRGRPRDPWTGEALGPAGGIRATVTDMATLVSRLLDGSAPGISALDPVADFAGSKVRIGAAWVVIEPGGRTITWHNGGTGGFRSYLGLDRAAGAGVIALSATTESVDQVGFQLLERISAGR